MTQSDAIIVKSLQLQGHVINVEVENIGLNAWASFSQLVIVRTVSSQENIFQIDVKTICLLGLYGVLLNWYTNSKTVRLEYYSPKVLEIAVSLFSSLKTQLIADY